jgi:hypothetical protein
VEKPINQGDLKKILKLPPGVINHIRDNKIIKWKKVGRQIVFDKESVKKFQSSFDMRDYRTVRQCSKILQRCDYYPVKKTFSKNPKNKGLYACKLDKFITVIRLIVGSSEIPKEHCLEVRAFGNTKFISRNSLVKTLRWLKGIENEMHSRQSEEELEKETDWKKVMKENPNKINRPDPRKGIKGLVRLGRVVPKRG